MPAHDPQLAPDAVLVRYLAVFRRFLTAVVQFSHDEDKSGMLLGGWLADALHNVPALLWYYEGDAYHDPEVISRWLADFPEEIQRLAAPKRLVAESKRILFPEDAARELGLREDLADLDLAPLPNLRVYLDTLAHACLSMRLLFNYGAHPSAGRQAVEKSLDACRWAVTGTPASSRYTPWKGLERAWTTEAQIQADANSRLAEALLPVPQGLVRWSHFDHA